VSIDYGKKIELNIPSSICDEYKMQKFKPKTTMFNNMFSKLISTGTALGLIALGVGRPSLVTGSLVIQLQCLLSFCVSFMLYFVYQFHSKVSK